MRTCKVCGKIKNLDEFRVVKYISHTCQECYLIKRRMRYKAIYTNPTKREQKRESERKRRPRYVIKDRVRHKLYYQANGVIIKARRNIWHADNKEYENRRTREYVRTPRGRLIKKLSRKRREILAEGLTLEVVQQVYEENIKKYGTLTCELCFKPVKFKEDSLEHFHPITRMDEYKGNNIHERINLGVAHGNKSKEQCNSRKGNKTLNEWFDYIAIANKG